MRFCLGISVLLLLSSCYMVEGKSIQGTAGSHTYQTDVAYKVTSEMINSLVPALVTSSEDAKHSLSEALKRLMGHYVPIAKQAFVNKSQIRLERKAQDPVDQPGLNGSLLAEQAPVIVISLKTDGRHCYLVHNQAQRLILIADLVCQPE